jgi:hypothetical protein
VTSPVAESRQSKVIWRRCTSNPTTIAPEYRSAGHAGCSGRPMTYRRSRSVPPVRLAGRAAAIRARLQRRSTRRTGHRHQTARITGRSCHLRPQGSHEIETAGSHRQQPR